MADLYKQTDTEILQSLIGAIHELRISNSSGWRQGPKITRLFIFYDEFCARRMEIPKIEQPEGIKRPTPPTSGSGVQPAPAKKAEQTELEARTKLWNSIGMALDLITPALDLAGKEMENHLRQPKKPD